MQPFLFIRRLPSIKQSKMKTLLRLFTCSILFSIILSSCGTTLYYNRTGEVNVPKQSDYKVTYIANIDDGADAKITYTESNGKKVKFNSIKSNWTKVVSLKSGQRVKFKVVTENKNQKVSTFKVLIDGKAVSEKEMNQKKSKYYYSFILP